MKARNKQESSAIRVVYEGDLARVHLGGWVCLMDSNMTHLLNGYRWRYADRGRKRYVAGYRCEGGKKSHAYLHRLVLGLDRGVVADHINGDTLDNRLENLRPASIRQNNLNARKKPSKHGNRFRGISTRRYGYASQIRVGGVIVHLGTFATDVEAAFAYDMASIKHHGEFGRRNFLPLA